jgi:hypothetical protein
LDNKYTCQSLPEGCLAANTDGNCTSCDNGYKLSNGVCITIPSDDHCAEYGYLSKGSHSIRWSYGCKKVCKKCNEGFYLTSDNACVETPAGCESVNADGTCNCCSKGYKLVSGVCIVDSSYCDDGKMRH